MCWIFYLIFEAKQYVIFKSVNVFFSEDTWLKGCVGLGITLIKIIHMSCHKLPICKLFSTLLLCHGCITVLFASLGTFSTPFIHVKWHLFCLLALGSLPCAHEGPAWKPRSRDQERPRWLESPWLMAARAEGLPQASSSWDGRWRTTDSIHGHTASLVYYFSLLSQNWYPSQVGYFSRKFSFAAGRHTATLQSSAHQSIN